jgi:hypothetical protein
MSTLQNDQYVLKDVTVKEQNEYEVTIITFSQSDSGPAIATQETKNVKSENENFINHVNSLNLAEHQQALFWHQQTLQDLAQLPDSPKYKIHKIFLEDVLSYFKRWMRDNNIKEPSLLSKTLKAQFHELFLSYYNNDQADPVEVQAILYDERRWKNPSKYIADERRLLGISAQDLASNPGFSWYNRQKNAKD